MTDSRLHAHIKTGVEEATWWTHIIPAAHGYAFGVKKGDHFRIVDLYGEQVVGR